jgi:hypothetical protein
MEKNTKEVIHCGFCDTELTKGVHVCRTCLATVKYGTPPGWLVFLVWLVGMVGGALIAMATQSGPSFFLGFVFMGIGFIVLKAIYADQITFHRK